MPTVHHPRELYSQLLEERRLAIADSERSHCLFGYAKVTVLAGAAALVWVALQHRAGDIVWLTVPIALFALLSALHERLLRQMERLRRAEKFFERGLARLDGHWAGTGETGESYLDPAHPYAADLDLFGKGSLFELLCTARTHIGEETLARWLLEAAPPPTVLGRNEAVKELRTRVDLREDLAILAEEARTGVDPLSLAAWGEAPAQLEGSRLRIAAGLLTVTGVAGLGALLAFGAYTFGILAMRPEIAVRLRDFFLVALLGASYFRWRTYRQVAHMAAAVVESAHQLGLVSATLVRLEQEHFHSPLLAELRSGLDAEGDPPSKRIARLGRLVELLDSREHTLVRAIDPFVLWTTHLAFAVEHWRRHSGSAVRRWLTATGEMEALCSLANHAFENPGDTFPEFVKEGPWLEVEAVGHPLIAEDRVVRNDVRIGGALRVLVVSGSNMAGKSTLLRALGTNAVLAQAGGTVRARKLVLSPLAIGASIRVVDSLQGGVSRFYAEILRLRQILDLTGKSTSVLFLIDEFLHGTNSHDRQIGAEAVVRGLVARGAAGLITTHDLALAQIAQSMGEQAANVHFEDQIENGQIRFDYKMRPGVVRKSNAIELMRSVGLEI